MSDEEAFLDALAANPADDTARLVYADWHGEPAKVEYLRLMPELIDSSREYDLESDIANRLLVAEQQVPVEWLNLAGRKLDLILSAIAPARKILAIKQVREVFRFSLKTSVTICETLPASLVHAGSLREAAELKALLRDRQVFQLLVTPTCNQNGCRPRFFYPIIEPWPLGLTEYDEDAEALAAAISVVLGDHVARLVRDSRVDNNQVLIRTPTSVSVLWQLNKSLADRPHAPAIYRSYIGTTAVVH